MCELIVLRAHFANTQFEAPCRRIRRYSWSHTSSRREGPGRTSYLAYIGGPVCELASLRAKICVIRNARRPTAAPEATRDHTRRTYIYGHGRPSYRGYIGGPEGLLVVFRAQFCEYALYWRPRGHTRRFQGPVLRIRNARRLTAAPVVTRGQTHRKNVHGHGRQSYRGYIVGPVCELACSRDLLAKTQCEAPYSRTRRYSLSHTSRKHIRSR